MSDLAITFGDGDALDGPSVRARSDVFLDLAACLERSGAADSAEMALEYAETPPDQIGRALNDIMEDVIDVNPAAVRCVGAARRAAAASVARPVVLAAQALSGSRCVDPRRVINRRRGR